jgi:hypothetical protein
MKPVMMTSTEIVDLARKVEAERMAFNSFGQDEQQYREDAAKLLKLRKVIINSSKIEIWWDKFSRNWVCQTLKRVYTSEDGFYWSQQDAADCTGNRDDAAISFCWAIIDADNQAK